MHFERLHTEKEVLDLINFHNSIRNPVILDCETTSKNPRLAKLIDIQLSGRNDDHCVIFAADKAHLISHLKPEITLVGHHYKYDIHVLFRHGIPLFQYTWRDTMLIAHLLDENRDSYALDSFVQEYWQDPYKEKFWAKYKTYEEASEEDKTEYACKDIYYTNLLFNKERKDYQLAGMPKSLVEHVHRLQASLLKTEIYGLKVDIPYLTDLGVELKRKTENLRQEMRALVKDSCERWEIKEYEKRLKEKKTEKGRLATEYPKFSFDSSKQLQWLLYQDLKFKPQRNEKTGTISSDEASLRKIDADHPVLSSILDYRGLQKTFTAFIEGTRERIDNGRIYPEFRVAGPVTGRIAHHNPNLGQVPASGGIRGIYIPDAGKVYLSADYSQLEVCLEANLTGDANLARIFTEGLSKHDITSRELAIDRDKAKTLNFALQYWCTAKKVAKLLEVSNEEGEKVYNKYWKLYKGPKQLKERVDADIDAGRVLQTVFGRRRRFEPRQRSVYDGDYRQGYNFLIQSLGADITSRAFYLISEWLERRGIGRGLFTVHDELLIEVNESNWQEAEDELLKTMVGVGYEHKLKIPLKAESSGPMKRWEG